MGKIKIMSICFLLLVGPLFSQSSSEQFKIVYMAEVDGINAPRDASGQNLLDKFVAWQATGINLLIQIRPYVVLDHYWDSVKVALKKIQERNLDIYIRISMNFYPTDSEFSASKFRNLGGPFNAADFHHSAALTTFTGEGVRNFPDGVDFYNYYSPIPDSSERIPNIAVDHARGIMKNFVTVVCDSLSNWSTRTKIPIKLVFPSYTPDDESGYPISLYYWDKNKPNPIIDTSVRHDTISWGVLTGYSNKDTEQFYTYLTGGIINNHFYPSIYNSASEINTKWGTAGTNDAINSQTDMKKIRTFGWERPSATYKYPKGRIDFLHYRAAMLKQFIDECATIIHDRGFQMGIQFGSVYDEGINFAGIIDVTPFLENADCIISDDIPEYCAQFAFGADYLRSACRFWNNNPSIETKVKKKFGTESNWPGYRGLKGFTLSYYWREQLLSFKDRGASIHFISHWGTSAKPFIPKAPSYFPGSPDSDYSYWYNTLVANRNQQCKDYDELNSSINHLGCEYTLYSRDWNVAPYYDEYTQNLKNPDYFNNNKLDGTVGCYLFPLYYFTTPRNQYSSCNTLYKDNGTFITNYMIEQHPEYIGTFAGKNMNFNATSSFVTNKAYERLSIYPYNSYTYKDQTWYNYSGNLYTIMYTPGKYNEYNEVRADNNLLVQRLSKSTINEDYKNNSETDSRVYSYCLEQNYPNPFNPTTIINYSVANYCHVKLTIFDLLGKEVSTIVNELKEPGKYQTTFNAADLNSGLYFYTIRAGEFVSTKKLMLIK
ncbi:MAG: T9SS type A sorting domain-containing protein [Acidobacteriota bacterium]